MSPGVFLILYALGVLAMALIIYWHAARETERFEREHPELKPNQRD